MSEPKLKRNLSFVSMVALASGAVIGGWLAEALLVFCNRCRRCYHFPIACYTFNPDWTYILRIDCNASVCLCSRYLDNKCFRA